MENYFSTEVARMEKELTRLKTSRQKSAAVFQTVDHSLDISIPLSLNASQTAARGSKAYKVIPEQDAIIMATLNWYSGNVLIDHRTPRTVRRVRITEYAQNGFRIITVSANGTQFGDNNDVQRLINGESVSVDVTLTVRATCNFTIQEANA